jgi:hypothetical protein
MPLLQAARPSRRSTMSVSYISDRDRASGSHGTLTMTSNCRARRGAANVETPLDSLRASPLKNAETRHRADLQNMDQSVWCRQRL